MSRRRVDEMPRGRANLFRWWVLCALFLPLGCATLPEPKHQKYTFPSQGVHWGIPQDRAFEKMGEVRAKAEFTSLDPNHEVEELCTNYFNQAAHQLLKYARRQGADAVIDVKSVVVLFDGKVEMHDRPECSDDGQEGQALARGIAVKWKK